MAVHGGLPSQCFHSLHVLLNEERVGLAPELFWNCCVKKKAQGPCKLRSFHPCSRVHWCIRSFRASPN